MFCSAAGARAGDGVEMEHAVRAWKEDNSGISVDERRELELERERERRSESAPLCCVLFISQTHSCTGEQGPGEEQRRGMREME